MKLLIIEDEKSLLKSIVDYFSRDDFLCETACSFAEGLQKIEGFDFDCIILDIGLPGGSGLKILSYLREEKKEDGVVIISAKNSLDDKIIGLDLGADDYLTKPFHLAELSARVKALIRRKYSNGVNQLEYGGIRVDLNSKIVSYQQQILQLTRFEYDLFMFLLINKNRVISKQAIAEHLTGEEVDHLDSLDFVYSHIKNLKRKLKERGCEDCIKAVYGFGYKFQL